MVRINKRRGVAIFIMACLVLACAGSAKAIAPLLALLVIPFILGALGSFVGCTATWISRSIFHVGNADHPLEIIAGGFYDEFVPAILNNPDLGSKPITDMMVFFIRILEPAYVVILLLLGIYIIFMSGSPAGKNKAKSMMVVVIVSMVAVLMSKYILMAMVSSSHSIAQWGIAQGVLASNSPSANELTRTTFSPFIDWYKQKWLDAGSRSISSSFIFLAIPTVLLLSAMIVLAIRYIVLVGFFVMFPMTIFLYSFKITRGIGRPLMEKTILWIFAQAAEGLMFAAVALVFLDSGITPLIGSDAMFAAVATAALLALTFTPPLMVLLFKDFLP